MSDLKNRLLDMSKEQIDSIRAWEVKKQIFTFTVLSTLCSLSQFNIIILSKKILEKIDASDYFVFTSGLMGLSGFLADILSAYYLIFIKHSVRVYVGSIFMSISMAMIIMAQERKDFLLYNLAVFTLTLFTNISAAALVGLAKVFPLGVSKGIAVGYSLAGIICSFVILTLEFFQVDYIKELVFLFFLCIPIFFLIRKIYVLKVTDEHISYHIHTQEDLVKAEVVSEGEIEQMEERETKINISLN